MPQGCHNSQTTGQAADLDHDDTALRPAPRKTSHALLSRCGALRVHLQHVNRLARRHACASAARRVTSYSDEPDRLTFAQQQRPSLAVTFMHSSPSSCHAVPPATKQGRQIRHRNCEFAVLSCAGPARGVHLHEPPAPVRASVASPTSGSNQMPRCVFRRPKLTPCTHRLVPGGPGAA